MNSAKVRFPVAHLTLAAILLVVASAPAQAVVFTWAGNGGSWGTAGSWLNGSVPTNGSDVLFTSAGNVGITASGVNITRSLASITFDSSVNRAFTLTGVSNVLTVNDLTNSSGFLQTLNNNLSFAGGTINTGTAGIKLGANSITGSGAVSKTGSGLLDIDASGSYSGTVTVSAGTVRLSTGLSSAAFVVDSGATLQSASNNQTKGLASSITVNNGGFLTPGDGTVGDVSAFNVGGNVTLNNGSTTTMDVAGTLSDAVLSSGSVVFGGDLKLNVADDPLLFNQINFVDTTADWNLNTPTTWQLFTGTAFSGNFSSVQFTFSGTTYNFQQGGADGLWRTVTNGVLGTSSGTTNEFIFATKDVTFDGQNYTAGTLYAVPEPSTIVFAGIGAAMFGWQTLTSRRRRNRRKSTEAVTG